MNKVSEAKRDDNLDPAALRAEIEETRADLGETVEALTKKANIKTQARKAVPIGGIVAALLVLLLAIRRIGRRKR